METGVGEGVAVGIGEGVADGVGVAEGFGVAVGEADGVAVGLGVAVAVGEGVGVGVTLAPAEVRANPVGATFTFPGLPMKPNEALPPGGIELCQE